MNIFFRFHLCRVLILMLFIVNSVIAQEPLLVKGKGKAVIFFDAGKNVPVVRVDSVLLVQSRDPIVLDTGLHIVKAWAPTKELFVDTFYVKEDRTTIMVKKLNYSREYLSFKQTLNVYKRKKTLTRIVPLPLTLIYSGLMYTIYQKNKKIMHQHYLNAESAAVGYGNSSNIDEYNSFQKLYYTERDSYEKYRKKNNTIVTASLISIPVAFIATAVLFYGSKKLKKPTYQDTPLLTMDSMSIQKNHNNVYCLSLKLKINR